MFLIRWLWKNLKGYRTKYITALILAAVVHVMFLIFPYFNSILIDTFIANENAAENLKNDLGYFFILIAIMIGSTLVRNLLQYIYCMFFESTSQGFIFNLRNFLFNNMQSQDATFFDYYRTGDIMTRLSGDIDMVRHSLAWIIRVIVESLVLFIGSVAFFFYLDPLMALLLIALTPVIFFISYFFRQKVKPLYQNLRDRLSDLNTGAEENISGNRVVKAFAREDFEIEKFTKMDSEYKEANETAAITWLRFFPGMEITAQALSVIQLVAGGIFVISGRLTLGEYSAFAGLIWAISNPMRQVGSIINDLQRFTASAYKIIEVYYSKPKIIDKADAVKINGRVKGSVEFKNVTFKYGNKTVLDDISFKIEAGQTVAIMGETGSGKTSLINLIPRIYDPNTGEILVDDINIRWLRLHELRSNIGIATQEVLLFSDTVDGNIAFGNTEMPFEEVQKYAQSADADGFIRKMSDGYETIIGERGVGLSGGQKQRIALARALAIKPAVLILDDTTSAVDLETEKHIQESLGNLDFPCTKIIIAQRISSTKDADFIIVLKDGKIAEQGTHDELIAGSGYYREVYDLQT